MPDKLSKTFSTPACIAARPLRREGSFECLPEKRERGRDGPVSLLLCHELFRN